MCHLLGSGVRDEIPSVLYIGCSCCQEPVSGLIAVSPKDLRIHQNVANQVFANDLGLLADLEYAISQEFAHIVVCGHEGCKCLESAVYGNFDGPIAEYFNAIKSLYASYETELAKYKFQEEKIDKLSELNVISQVKGICEIQVLKKALDSGFLPQLHGWLYRHSTQEIESLALSFSEWEKLGLVPKNYGIGT